MTGPPTPTSPDSGFTIPSETFKAVGWFVLRLALTLVIVSRLILFLSEPLQHLIARGAHNLLAMVSWQYDLKTIEYIDGGLGVGSLMGIFCSRPHRAISLLNSGDLTTSYLARAAESLLELPILAQGKDTVRGAEGKAKLMKNVR